MKKINLIIIFLLIVFSNYSQTYRTVNSNKYNYSLKLPVAFSMRTPKNSTIDFSAADKAGASINLNANPFDFKAYTYNQVSKEIIESIIKPQVDYFSITKFDKTKISTYNSVIMTCDVTVGKQAFTQLVAFVYYKNNLTLTCSCNKKDFASYKKNI